MSTAEDNSSKSMENKNYIGSGSNKDTVPLIIHLAEKQSTTINVTDNFLTSLSETHSPTKNDNDDTSSSLNGGASALMCRICHCEETSEEYLITPCYCTGTLRHVHQCCLQQWLKSTGTKSCELCKFEFIMQTKIRPFKNWEKLDMNNIERRKILCSVTFHLIAITCVIWSLYVLIERTAEEIRSNNFEWSFWIKLIVVAIGFTGGCVFMYIQCKMYFQLCVRWRQYNRVIIIQPITEEILKTSKKRLLEKNIFLFSNKSSNSNKTSNNNNSKIHDENSSTFGTINTNQMHINQLGADTILSLSNSNE